VVELWVPTGAATAVQRQKVNRAIDDMVQAVEAACPKLVQLANVEGARRETAAALLLRALELLASARAADKAGPAARPAVELTVRSGFEVTCRGRFLVLSPNASDEFVRLVSDFARKDKAIAKKIRQQPAPLPPFLAAIVDPDPKKPHDLWAICVALDKIEGRSVEDTYSARACYVPLYQWMSNAAAHGGLGSVRRFTREEHGVLHLVQQPKPMTTHWPIPIFAGHVGELARVVLSVFEQPTEELTSTGVVLPTPSTPH
jgi:hypothetical protein